MIGVRLLAGVLAVVAGFTGVVVLAPPVTLFAGVVMVAGAFVATFAAFDMVDGRLR